MGNNNTLDVGESRIGSLYDGDPDTPQPRASLGWRNGRIILSVPWDEPGSAVSRWFHGAGAMWGDDPDKTKHAYEVPNLLDFHDQRGSVRLVGCRSAGMSNEIISNLGVGYISAAFVVFERAPVAGTFDNVRGLQTSISGLREWLGVQSVHRGVPDLDDAGKLIGISYLLRSPDPVPVPGVAGLKFVPRWLVDPGERDTTVLRDFVSVESCYDDARPWADHLGLHRGVRDLIALSRWRREAFVELAAKAGPHPDDDGREVPWAPTIPNGILGDAPHPSSRQHLIEYGDIGDTGIAAWLDVRDEYQRAVDPIVSSLYSDLLIEASVSQVGIGLEALGYLLAQNEHGKTEREANALNYVARFMLISTPMADVLPFAVDEWSTKFADAYNSVKHANRTLPEVAELANRWREAVLVFRAWIALKLGVQRDVLKSRLLDDPQARPYKLIST